MRTTLDGKALFDERDLEIRIDPWERIHVERAVPGLDGVLSIDLGQRSRRIHQRGTLRAVDAAGMASRLSGIEAFCDGDTHTLLHADGRSYANVRVDALTEHSRDVTGVGVALTYEIIYTQLGD